MTPVGIPGPVSLPSGGLTQVPIEAKANFRLTPNA